MPMSAKQRRAAALPDRPGERCPAPDGTYIPVIDTPHAWGSGTAIDVCPTQSLEPQHDNRNSPSRTIEHQRRTSWA